MEMESSVEVLSHNFALLTLKERCHLLKQQLQSVDDENLRLKVQIAHLNSSDNHDHVSGDKTMVDQVEKLSKEKNQLLNKIHILATENKNIWSRLSTLTLVNRSLSRRLSKISETLDKHGLQTSTLELGAEVKDSNEYCKNIEEMSLKLINNLKLEKLELETQYEQIVALHSNDVCNQDQELQFCSTDMDDDTALAVVRKHALKLNNFKKKMLDQQNMLATVLTEIKKMKDLPKSESICVESRKDASTETDRTINITLNEQLVTSNPIEVSTSLSEQICPLCGEHIPGESSHFVDHVSNHFQDTEDDFGTS